MNVLALMIPIAMILGGVFLAAFIWSVQMGQFDDTNTPAHRILIDDENKKENT